MFLAFLKSFLEMLLLEDTFFGVFKPMKVEEDRDVFDHHSVLPMKGIFFFFAKKYHI